MSHWWTALSDVSSMTTLTVYVVVFALVFVESGLLVGFFLPGDSVLFAAGLLAAERGGDLHLWLLAGGTAVFAVAGDAVGYWTGRRFGRPWLLRRAGRNADRVLRAEAFYERWGSLAVIIARFIPWVRTFTPIIAGIGRMPYPKFFVANVLGALIWGSGMILLGYAAHQVPWVKWAAYVIAAVAISATIVALVIDRRRMKAAGSSGPSGRSGPSGPSASAGLDAGA
ncbi:DedA family protein [Kineosporia succinea]|uniref:Membrane-associated protein n=1 Tax=Kineosporia succinea TaxID=84632 RepID=A0ABT9P1S1_9ACTN|nr:DedA family protein [Kineosporia succinea]MDP9826624.1 membrane-associated protein [Kineosporia succinea]